MIGAISDATAHQAGVASSFLAMRWSRFVWLSPRPRSRVTGFDFSVFSSILPHFPPSFWTARLSLPLLLSPSAFSTLSPQPFAPLSCHLYTILETALRRPPLTFGPLSPHPPWTAPPHLLPGPLLPIPSLNCSSALLHLPPDHHLLFFAIFSPLPSLFFALFSLSLSLSSEPLQATTPGLTHQMCDFVFWCGEAAGRQDM